MSCQTRVEFSAGYTKTLILPSKVLPFTSRTITKNGNWVGPKVIMLGPVCKFASLKGTILWFWSLECEYKGQIVSKLDLDLLNEYKLMYFDRNHFGNNDGKILECNKWVLCNHRWIPLYYPLQKSFTWISTLSEKHSLITSQKMEHNSIKMAY